MNASKTPITQNNNILHDNPEQAMQEMILISRMLFKIAERESQALAQNDLMSLAILQDEKEMATNRYQKASEEFRGRLEQFRQVPKTLVDQLEALQKQINEVMQNNNRTVLQMRESARESTQQTLITAQELGQSKPVAFESGWMDAPEGENTEERV